MGKVKQIEVIFEIADGCVLHHYYSADVRWSIQGRWVIVRGAKRQADVHDLVDGILVPAEPMLACYMENRVICIRPVETDEPEVAEAAPTFTASENEDMLKEQFTDRGV